MDPFAAREIYRLIRPASCLATVHALVGKLGIWATCKNICYVEEKRDLLATRTTWRSKKDANEFLLDRIFRVCEWKANFSRWKTKTFIGQYVDDYFYYFRVACGLLAIWNEIIQFIMQTRCVNFGNMFLLLHNCEYYESVQFIWTFTFRKRKVWNSEKIGSAAKIHVASDRRSSHREYSIRKFVCDFCKYKSYSYTCIYFLAIKIRLNNLTFSQSFPLPEGNEIFYMLTFYEILINVSKLCETLIKAFEVIMPIFSD